MTKYKIDPTLQATNFQAIKCRVHDIAVPDEHLAVVRDYFSERLSECGKDLKVRNVREDRDGVYHVKLTHTNGQDVADMLSDQGYAYRRTFIIDLGITIYLQSLSQ